MGVHSILTILQKELNSFFSSLTGYIAIAVFLVLTGLIMWVFPNNVLEFGYASLDLFFDNAPFILLLLIPAITMRLIAEEKKTGTLEIISTKPITTTQVILGKYFAAVLLVWMALLPTLLYFYTVAILATPPGNVDTGAIYGSYIGLCLLSATFVAIGLFASALTENQIVAFILGAFFCFFFFLAFQAFSGLGFVGGKADSIIESIGIQYHYSSISRGIADTRDLLYFLSLIVIFILSTNTALERTKW